MELGSPARSARLAAWERPQELTTCDLSALRIAHQNLNTHQMKVASARGRGHLNMSRVEREAEEHRKRSESMKISRRKHREAALADRNNENVKLVERLVTVMKDSEKRMRSMVTPREPAPRQPEAGSLNIGYRRKVNQHIRKDNEQLFDRLMNIQGTLATKSQLAERYDHHKELVARTSRMRRRWDAEPTEPDLTRPQTPRDRPPLHAPKQQASHSPRKASTLERRANNAAGSKRSLGAHAAGHTPSRPSSRASAPAAPRAAPSEPSAPQASETESRAENRAQEEADEGESGDESFESESRSSRSRSSSSRASSRSRRSRSSSRGGSRAGGEDSTPSGSKQAAEDSARPDGRARPADQPAQREVAAEKDEEEQEEFDDDFDEASEQEASEREASEREASDEDIFEDDDSASDSSNSSKG